MRQDDIGAVFSTSEAIDASKYVIVDYALRLRAGSDPRDVVASIAINTSLGSMTPLPYEKVSKRHASVARVIQFDGHKLDYRARIAYPNQLFGTRPNIPHILTVVWYAVEYHIVEGLWVEAIALPESIVNQFEGPRKGIQGVRDLLGVPHGPLLAMNLKPRLGVPLITVLRLINEAVKAGVNIIFDDELIVDQEGEWSFDNRVPRIAETIKCAHVENQPRTAYFPNMTGTMAQVQHYLKIAINASIMGVLTNAFTMGFSAFHDICRLLPSPAEMPILVSSGIGTGMVARTSGGVGTADVVFAKLTRLSGADAVYAGLASSDLWYTPDVVQASLAALRSPMHGLKPAMPIVSGGLNIAKLPVMLPQLGPDVVLLCGTGLLGYPGGVGEGVVAMRAMIDALKGAGTLEEAEDRAIELGLHNRAVQNGLDRYGFTQKGA